MSIASIGVAARQQRVAVHSALATRSLSVPPTYAGCMSERSCITCYKESNVANTPAVVSLPRRCHLKEAEAIFFAPSGRSSQILPDPNPITKLVSHCKIEKAKKLMQGHNSNTSMTPTLATANFTPKSPQTLSPQPPPPTNHETKSRKRNHSHAVPPPTSTSHPYPD